MDIVDIAGAAGFLVIMGVILLVLLQRPRHVSVPSPAYLHKGEQELLGIFEEKAHSEGLDMKFEPAFPHSFSVGTYSGTPIKAYCNSVRPGPREETSPDPVYHWNPVELRAIGKMSLTERLKTLLTIFLGKKLPGLVALHIFIECEQPFGDFRAGQFFDPATNAQEFFLDSDGKRAKAFAERPSANKILRAMLFESNASVVRIQKNRIEAIYLQEYTNPSMVKQAFTMAVDKTGNVEKIADRLTKLKKQLNITPRAPQ